jgi:hypothetical protein
MENGSLEKHQWSRQDRLLLCNILKALGIAFRTCNTMSEMSALTKEHYEIFEKASAIMSEIYQKPFTKEQIQFQIWKPHMHQQAKRGQKWQQSQFEMVSCMIETELMDNDGFYNFHYAYFDLKEKNLEEKKILEEAAKIKARQEQENRPMEI